MIHLEGAGHVLDRNQFEKDIYTTATESCAKIIEGTLIQHLAEKGKWYLTTDSNTDLECNLVIDATGRAQSIGRAVTKIKTGDRLAAAVNFAFQKVGSQVQPTAATLIETVETGWWYAALIASGELVINYYSDPDLMPKGLSKNINDWRDLIQQTQHISYWIEDAEFIIDSPPQITSAATRWLMQAADIYNDAAWVAVGDAAVSFDPLSAHGMTTALWGAAQTARVAESWLQGDATPLNKYAIAVNSGVNNFLDQQKQMYEQERRFKNSTFWSRRLKDE